MSKINIDQSQIKGITTDEQGNLIASINLTEEQSKLFCTSDVGEMFMNPTDQDKIHRLKDGILEALKDSIEKDIKLCLGSWVVDNGYGRIYQTNLNSIFVATNWRVFVKEYPPTELYYSIDAETSIAIDNLESLIAIANVVLGEDITQKICSGELIYASHQSLLKAIGDIEVGENLKVEDLDLGEVEFI